MRLLFLILLFFSITVSFSQAKRTESEAKALIDTIYQKIQRGTDFGDMAMLYSDDPGSASKRGDYDWIKKGTFIKEFEKVVFFKLKKGAIFLISSLDNQCKSIEPSQSTITSPASHTTPHPSR